MCLLFCFVLFWILCCVVCEKNENKKLLITKKIINVRENTHKTVHNHIAPLPEGVSSHRGSNMARGGWELGRRLRRRTDTREGAGRQRPGGRRRREEPGKRQERPGAGGAWRDPGHSHNGGPRWSRRREEEWPPTPGGRPMAVEQVVEEPRGGEPTSQRDTEDPGGKGGAEGSGDQGKICCFVVC